MFSLNSDFAKRQVRQFLQTTNEADLLRQLDALVLSQMADHQLETLRLHLERRVYERREARQAAILSLGMKV